MGRETMNSFTCLVLLAALIYPTNCIYIANCRQQSWNGDCTECDQFYYVNSYGTCSVNPGVQIFWLICCICCCLCLCSMVAQSQRRRQEQMMRQRAVAQGNYMAAGYGANNNPYRFNQNPVVIGGGAGTSPYGNNNYGTGA